MENKNKSEILLYKSGDGSIRINVLIQDNSVWLSQKGIAELYQTTIANINQHITNIYEERELLPDSTIKKYLIVQTEGKREVERLIDHYNLDVILAIGYRVRSISGTQFRQWATEHLKEYLVKGFTIDDLRLKSGQNIGDDYFEELLERIRDIRSSERRFYQKITDIYAQCSIDYDPQAQITQDFYAMVQNKLHWAIHGHTAAEIISERADADKPFMGLTTWKNAPKGMIRKNDVTVAKNYLTEDEIGKLNRIVNMYLDYAELQAEKRSPMTMEDWSKKLDSFLRFNEKNILEDAGKISAEIAKQIAEREFDKYKEHLRELESTTPVSDFDKEVEKIKKLKSKDEKAKRGNKEEP
ncbi:MAG: virulence RhuM family protein [Brevinematales bacterium]|nr:virulence RhuM family protein [Brevinematales bacterium]